MFLMASALPLTCITLLLYFTLSVFDFVHRWEQGFGHSAWWNWDWRIGWEWDEGAWIGGARETRCTACEVLCEWKLFMIAFECLVVVIELAVEYNPNRK